MNVPMSWLKEYVDIDCSVRQYMEDITITGTKVESLEQIGREISKVVVGKIMSITQHPDADRLVITQVDIGEKQIQIVTGATNLYEGAYVPVALDGSTLAGGQKIKSGKLRGQVSDGMLCSIEELGYNRTVYPEAPEDGIYIFKEEQPLGADAADILMIADDVVEYELTSNRSDCYSVLGIAREAAATYRKELKLPKIELQEKADGQAADYIQVEIKNPELCPRYIARVVKNVKIGPSPLWMRHRLAASGLNPINNIVDITNYVMLELGQPMHAFDIDMIKGGKIIVRNAEDGEKFTTLDQTERVLSSSMLVIADEEKAVAIAGIMGGENSKVTGEASAILFESANFNGVNVRLSSKKLGLRTDASGKYEKGLDPNIAEIAVNRAVQLVELLQAGDVVPGMVDSYPGVRIPLKISYSIDKINSIIGIKLTEAEIKDMLKYVDIEMDTNSGLATIPTFRPDVEINADLAEEVARLYGYDKIPVTLAAGTPTVGKMSFAQTVENMVKDCCVSLGLSEALNYSFESPKAFDKLNLPPDSPLRRAINILNPLGEDYSIMRTSSLNLNLNSLATNFKRRNPKAGLFEIANVFNPDELPLTKLLDEKLKLTISMYGMGDFFDLKGMVHAIISRMGMDSKVSYVTESELPFMHPGRTAAIKIGDESIGFLGEVHPTVTDNYEIATKVLVAVVDMAAIIANAELIRQYRPLPKFPAISRDIAMLVKDDMQVGSIEEAIRRRAGKNLTSLTLFDVYKGAQIQEGYKSVAYSLTFRAQDRTLTDDEVSQVMKKILTELEEQLGAQLRDK